MKDHLRELVAQSLLDLRRHGRLGQDVATPDFVVERTKSRDHGDYASNIALLLAKPAGMKPRELAELLVDALPASQHVEKVSIAGFGVFETVDRPARDGRNPQTGAAVNIPARTVPKFSAGKGLKDAVN